MKRGLSSLTISFIAMFILAMMVLVLADCGAAPLLNFHYTNNVATAYPYKTINIWVDKDFGEADRVSIDDAIMQWNYALNGSIVLKVNSYEFEMTNNDVLNEVKVKGNGWLFLKIDHR